METKDEHDEGANHTDLVQKWGGNMDPAWCDVRIDGSGISKIRDKYENCTHKFSPRHVYVGEKGSDYTDREDVNCHNCNTPFRIPRL